MASNERGAWHLLDLSSCSYGADLIVFSHPILAAGLLRGSEG